MSRCVTLCHAMEYCPKLRSNYTVLRRLNFRLAGVVTFPLKTGAKIEFSAKNYIDTMNFGSDLTFQAAIFSYMYVKKYLELPSVALRLLASYLYINNYDTAVRIANIYVNS